MVTLNVVIEINEVDVESGCLNGDSQEVIKGEPIEWSNGT